MAYTEIPADSVKAKEPVDEDLMVSVRDDLAYLFAKVAAGGFPISWEVIGPVRRLTNFRAPVGISPATEIFTPRTLRITFRKSGTGGSAQFDLRKILPTNTPITAINHLFDGLTQSIGNVAPALATQSVSRTSVTLSTQSVTFAKGAVSIQSIVAVPGTNRWRYNLSGVDADWKAGDTVVFNSATAGGNNGSFVIYEVNQSGGSNVVIVNASGVAQATPAGTAQLMLMSYNLVNPAPADYVVGERAIFAGHTGGTNNGTLQIYGVNVSGNNVLVKNSGGVTQGAVAGTLDVCRWKFAFSVAADGSDFVVGEKAKTSGHTSGGNNGNLLILALNSGGMNIVVYNELGVAQAAAGGTVNTNRWAYGLSTDPTFQVTVGDSLQLENHTSPANNGIFKCLQLRRGNVNNVVIYNESGVAQASVAGNVRTTKKTVSFATDQASVYSVGNMVEIVDTPDGKYVQSQSRPPWTVLEVNRGGGASYNIVIDVPGASAQLSPAGIVICKMISLFISPPTISADPIGNSPKRYVTYQFTNFVSGPVPEGTMIGFFVNSMFTGAPEDITAFLQ